MRCAITSSRLLRVGLPQRSRRSPLGTSSGVTLRGQFIDPYIVYPGNIQGRHGKEQGEKSCELVTVSDAGVVSIKAIPTSVVPWFEEEIGVSDCVSADDVYNTIRLQIESALLRAKERVSALRLRLVGTTQAHAELNSDSERVRNEAISIVNRVRKRSAMG